MDRHFKLSLLGAVVFAAANFSGAALTSANAADLLPPPAVVEAPEVVQPANSGWYLRGDISYDFNEIEDAHVSNLGAERGWANGPDAGEAFNIGAGLGYQITNHFRVDVTGEYVFGSEFHGNSSRSDTTNCVGGEGTCVSTEEGEFTQTRLLANAYVDVGKFGGLTPYVGAGIGGAYVSYDDFASKNECTNAAVIVDPFTHVPCPAAPTATGDKFDGESSWRFAYALHAGAAYDLSRNLKLDVGYTYTKIEGGKMGTNTTLSQRFDDKGFSDHTIRAGLRYNLW